MEFEKPNEDGFTIYSKSGCPNCSKAKELIKSKNLSFKIIDCDDYIIEERDNFLIYIEKLTQQTCKAFPIVFNNGVFLGGYSETKEYINKLFVTFDENLSF